MNSTAPCTLRRATALDVRRIWEWRNDADARRASFDPNPIPFESHEQWFARKLGDPHSRIFIAEVDGTPVAYVRFEVDDGHAEISVAVDPLARGRGYGPAAIAEGARLLFAETAVERITALVKLENSASRVAFERAGFVHSRDLVVNGCPAGEFVCGR